MRKAMAMVSGILLAMAVVLSGCILFKTPIANDVAMNLGQEMTFSVKVFPSNATYTWRLDGGALSNSSSNFTYTAQEGDHILEVKAKHSQGTDVQIWTIHTPVIPEPVTELLDSLVTIPAGSFMMGSDYYQNGWERHSMPVHEVTLQSFDIGRYEVTQAQYEAVMGTNPSYFQASNSYPYSANRPVECVLFKDAKAFCRALSTLTGRTFTLPSEAQWEYACRAGTTTLYSWGDSDSLIDYYAWWGGNAFDWDNPHGPHYGTNPVGTRLPNPWGLYDMHGNVSEFCLDTPHGNYDCAPTDGSAWDPNAVTYLEDEIFDKFRSIHIQRGGYWNIGSPMSFQSAHRDSDYCPDMNSPNKGFRVIAVR